MEDYCDYQTAGLTIVVIGASGDLAKKKTYPSLFQLYLHGYLPSHTLICGYARSSKSDTEFRSQLKPYLKSSSSGKTKAFLDMCLYREGGYDVPNDLRKVVCEIEVLENKRGTFDSYNRLFYFAIPPSVFVPIGTSIKEAGLTSRGRFFVWLGFLLLNIYWNRFKSDGKHEWSIV